MSQPPEFAPAHVSVVNEVPEDLYEAMRRFVTSHPSWDQYRLMQVALAGFLFQQGSRERAVTRHYLDGLFDRGGAPEAPVRQEPSQAVPPGAAAAPASAPAPTQVSRPPLLPSPLSGPSRSASSDVAPRPVPTVQLSPPSPPLHRQGPPLPPRRGL